MALFLLEGRMFHVIGSIENRQGYCSSHKAYVYSTLIYSYHFRLHA